MPTGRYGLAALIAASTSVGGAVDVAAELELDRELGEAERARRGELGDAGNLRELLLERRRHRRRHGLRIGARQLRRDLDGRDS